jgi:hypothetical protein
MDPKEVGRQVLEAIKEERLYVITHDFNVYIETRLKNILGSKNPEPMELPQDMMEIVQELMEQ